MSAAIALDVRGGTARPAPFGTFNQASALDGYLHDFGVEMAQRKRAVRIARTSGTRGDAHKVIDFESHPRVKAARQRLDVHYRAKQGDDFNAQSGLATARELEHIYSEVLREEFPEMTGLTLFPVDPSVPAGARKHTVRRIYGSGSAAVYRAGMDNIPMAGIGKEEETFNIRHYVNGFVLDIFSAASANLVSIALASELLREARDAMMRFANDATWYGLPEHGIYGVLDYPWLAKYIESQAFNDSQGTLDQLKALHRIANYANDTQRGVARPNAMAVATRVYNHISSTQLSVDNSKTILQAFLENNPFIKTVVQVDELSGVGPGGYDGILVYRNDRLGITNVIPTGFTPIPVQRQGFETLQLAYMTHGGVIMRQVMNNLLAWVAGPALA